MIAWLFLLTIAVHFALAFVFYSTLGIERQIRTQLFLILAGLLLLTPIIIPAAEPLIRFIVAVNTVFLLVKLYDVLADTNQGQRLGLRTFAIFLISPTLFRRAPDVKIFNSKRRCLFRLATAFVGLSIATSMLVGLFLINWRTSLWILEHGLKVVTLILATVYSCMLLVAAWQICGGASGDIMRHPILARTPADFWRRFNVPMQRFFYERIFIVVNGRQKPIRASLVVFVISGIMHEYVFGIALCRVEKWQMAFFILQWCAVVMTIRIKPQAWRAVLWTTATLSFNIISGVLFFAGVNGLFPFYSRPLPAWWQAWFG